MDPGSRRDIRQRYRSPCKTPERAPGSQGGHRGFHASPPLDLVMSSSHIPDPMDGKAGYPATSLSRKLGLKPGMRVRILHAPGFYAHVLGLDLETLGVERLDDLSTAADFTHLFAADRTRLAAALALAHSGMAPDGMVWASWPKRSSSVASAIGRPEVLAAGKARGLVDVKACAVDDAWSAVKFVMPR